MVAGIIGLLLSLVEALGTGLIPFLPRLLYWEILMISGAVIGLGVSEAVERWGKLATRKWAEIPFVALLIALPLTLLVIGTGAVFFGSAPRSIDAMLAMFVITFIVSLVMTAINYLLHMPVEGQPAISVAPTDSDRFTERLPLPLRSLAINALEAEDHYLRVHFADGQSTLILLRLSDAIAELPADKGAQTHRSWWIAKNAVRSVAKADGRATLQLDHGITAPVSRSYYKALGEAGWLT